MRDESEMLNPLLVTGDMINHPWTARRWALVWIFALFVMVGCGEEASSPAMTVDGGDSTGADGNDSDGMTMSGASNVGKACSDNSECGELGICAMQLPGGYCVTSCAMRPCAEGSTCVPFNGGQPFCFATCERETDCRQGYRCLEVEIGSATVKVCDLECLSDGDCEGEGIVCNEGLCGPPPPTQALGDACAASSECLSGLCVRDDEMAEGFCSTSCTTTTDCSEATWTCQSFEDVEMPGVVAQRCGPAKAVGEACELSTDCISQSCLVPADGGVCAEPCVSGQCSLTGWSCQDARLVDLPNANLQLCAPGGGTQLTEIDLPIGGPYSFDVPADAVSFMIVGVGTDPTAFISIRDLTNPNGDVVSDGGRSTLTMDGFVFDFPQPLRFFGFEGYFSVLVPNNNNDALQPIPGTWTFGVNDNSNPVTSLKVLIRRSPEPIVASRFDVTIFIAPGVRTGLTASTAPNDVFLNEMLQTLGAFLQPIDVRIGDVRYVDMAPEYLVIDDDAELRRMWRTQSTRGVDGALNLFFVRDLPMEGGDDFSSLGIAGGIPGAVGINGTSGSGVVFVPDGGPAPIVGEIVAHEVGHFLGLFHVTERGQSQSDVIADTSVCGDDPDALSSQFFNTGMIPDPCAENIMFPLAWNSVLAGFGIDPFVELSFSNIQGRVILNNPMGR